MKKIKDWLLKHKKRVYGVTAAALFAIVTIIGAVTVSENSKEPLVVKAESRTNKTDSVSMKYSDKKKDVTEDISEKPKDDVSKKDNSGKDKKEDNKKSTDIGGTQNQKAGENSGTTNTGTKQTSSASSTGSEISSEANTKEPVEEKNQETVPDAPSAQPEKPRVWHDPVYEERWIVDQAAWDETISEPIYETREIAVGNQSGTIIEGDPNEYLLDNPNGDTGWHSEVQQVQTGTNSYVVHHDEIGHYEKVLVREGYWE